MKFMIKSLCNLFSTVLEFAWYPCSCSVWLSELLELLEHLFPVSTRSCESISV